MHGSPEVGAVGSAQGWHHHGHIALPARRDATQPIHQPVEHALLFVLIAIAHASAPGVAPDLGGYEQEAQPRGRQSCVLQRGGVPAARG